LQGIKKSVTFLASGGAGRRAFLPFWVRWVGGLCAACFGDLEIIRK